MRVAPTLMAIVAILVVSAFQSPCGAQLNSTEETMATLRGVVTAAGGAVIPNATLVISDAKTKRKIVTNEDGAYAIELPGGSYRLSTEIPHYFPFRRAELCLKSGTITIVNISPVLRDIGHILAVPPARGGTVRGTHPKYESLSVPSRCGSVVIEYGKRMVHNRFIEYVQATASYDALTIYADRMHLTKRTLLLVTDGDDVVVEDGKRRLHMKHAEINFKAGDPLASLMGR